MSNEVASKSSNGIGILGLLGVAFVVLKLCDVIDWSWWWVTAPFWMPVALIGLILLGLGISILIVQHNYKKNKKK